VSHLFIDECKPEFRKKRLGTKGRSVNGMQDFQVGVYILYFMRGASKYSVYECADATCILIPYLLSVTM